MARDGAMQCAILAVTSAGPRMKRIWPDFALTAFLPSMTVEREPVRRQTVGCAG
jgi:hypothetical protein